jgi:hypothetical protein
MEIDCPMESTATTKSGAGVPHSKSLRRFERGIRSRASVLECGASAPLSSALKIALAHRQSNKLSPQRQAFRITDSLHTRVFKNASERPEHFKI